MSIYTSPYRLVLGLALLATAPMAVVAADSNGPLSPADSTPGKLELMQGFPPEAAQRVTKENSIVFPKSRWAFGHIRELGPTLNVWANAAAGKVSALDERLHDVRGIQFADVDGQDTTVGDWLDANYTDAFMVLHDGKIAYEYYADGVQPHEPHLLMSDTKSVTGLLAADLIARGELDPDKGVIDYIPELKGSAWEDATVQQTLDMTTGVRFTEVYSDPDSDINRYAVTAGMVAPPADYDGPESMYDYLQTLPKEGEHGERFTYRTVNPEVIGWIIQRVSGKKLNELLSEKIWQPMGAENDAYFITDRDGMAQAGGGLNATLRDMARFGEMVRNRGQFNGQTILPAQVYDRVFAKDYAVKLPEEDYPNGRKGYSYHDFWWLTNNDDGAVEGWGIGGQFLHINPTTKTVIVKQSSRPELGNNPYSAMATRAFAAIDQALGSSD